ncbi:type VI secretion system baseplate subunit TssF [Salmonella sp. WGH-01]|nr:type VI secretion system baseplate subunit TssF [Salmonella sp. WGH-01]
MAVVKLYPDTQEGDGERGHRAARYRVRFPIPEGENTACQFRSSRDVTLWPLSIEEVRLTAAPPDMPALHRYLPPNIHVAGALRITLRTFGNWLSASWPVRHGCPLPLRRRTHCVTPV